MYMYKQDLALDLQELKNQPTNQPTKSSFLICIIIEFSGVPHEYELIVYEFWDLKKILIIHWLAFSNWLYAFFQLNM